MGGPGLGLRHVSPEMPPPGRWAEVAGGQDLAWGDLEPQDTLTS